MAVAQLAGRNRFVLELTGNNMLISPEHGIHFVDPHLSTERLLELAAHDNITIFVHNLLYVMSGPETPEMAEVRKHLYTTGRQLMQEFYPVR